jgi:hypothetical protein
MRYLEFRILRLQKSIQLEKGIHVAVLSRPGIIYIAVVRKLAPKF